MPVKQLASNVILAEVLPTLSKPVDYVCGVLDHLYKCRAKHGNAYVALGTTGKGLKPYYRVSYSTAEGPKVYGTFFDNHVPFSSEGLPMEGGLSWSTRSMSLDEVAQLRRALRG